MVARANPASRLRSLLKLSAPRPDQRTSEAGDLEEFRRAKFGGKGMASRLRTLGSHSARRAVDEATAGRVERATSELSEAFIRRYWSSAIVGAADPNTAAAQMLEAMIRTTGSSKMTAVVRNALPSEDRGGLYTFARWALSLADWDGRSPLFAISPYVSEDPRTPLDAAPAEVALQQMCEWHLRVALREKDYSPFMFQPHILLPVEVFAWAKRREQLGLTVPAFESPLLQTPIAKIPLPRVELAPKDHPLIQPLLARCLKDGVLTAEQIEEMSEGSEVGIVS